MHRLSLALVLLVAPLSAQAGPIDTDGLRAAFAATVGSGRPGAVLVVVRGGEVVFAEATGAYRYGDRARASSDTLFALGRLSTLVTDYLAAQWIADGALDLDTKVAELIAPVALRDADGEPSDATLGQVVRREVFLPKYWNLVEPEELDEWSIDRALSENCYVSENSLGDSTDLREAIIEKAVERETGSTWADAVAARVGSEHAFARRTLAPTERLADGFRQGMLGMSARETRMCPDIAAARGMVMDATGLGDWLRAVVAATQASDAGDRIELQSFYRDRDAGRWYEYAKGPGVRAAIEVHDAKNSGWVYVTNGSSEHGDAWDRLQDELRAQLALPDRESGEDMWNSAVGMGGGVSKPIERGLRGTWTAEFTCGGRQRQLDLMMSRSGIAWLRTDASERVMPDRGSAFGGTSAYCYFGRDPLEVRDDVADQVSSWLHVDYDEDRGGFSGQIRISGSYYAMEFPLVFSLQ